MSDASPNLDLYSIGEVSSLTGLSPHTIRVWERRYGVPVPHRLPSGHRRYERHVVDFLQAAAELASYGQKPSEVLPLSLQEALARVTEERGKRSTPQANKVESALTVGSNALRLMLESSIRELGVRQTLHEFIVPLVTRIGQAWAEQRIDIRQEHILSETIEDILRATRIQIQPAEANDDQADVLLATLPGERHGLGLQMLALLTALENSVPLILGVDLPIDQVVEAAQQFPQADVAISVSSAAEFSTTTRQLQRLREALPASTMLLVGGAGMVRRQALDGVLAMTDFPTYESWLRQRDSGTPGRRGVR
ncbi:MAG: MerR family transcriptional regulator [Planctomycetota bacterium]